VIRLGLRVGPLRTRAAGADSPLADLLAMLRPYEGRLPVFPVSTMVNGGRVDEAMCLARAGAVG
jgi:hypothetical protein